LVSAIIPARNEEASIARAVESVAAQPEIDEVIVVDDESTDRTAAILNELSSQIPKLKALPAGELPAGWVGKNHAVAVGAAAAHGDWLLFTDADTYHLPGAMTKALADATEHRAVMVSYSPEQEMETWWERALIPFVYCRLAAKFSFDRVNDPARPDAAANGQFILVSRDVYRKAGGHAAIAGSVLEDVALARRIKGNGDRIYFSAPVGVVQTRMYRTFGAMWQGWTKNLYPLVGGSWNALVGEFLTSILLFGGGIAILLVNHARWEWVIRFVLFYGAMMVVILHGFYASELHRNRYLASYIRYWIPGVCLYHAALIASWWKNTRGAVEWKGRKYATRASVEASKRIQ
jgi:glycosyltransferase involved in cell wall biosynthesis